MFVRRNGICGVYSIIFVFILSLFCFLIALRSLHRDESYKLEHQETKRIMDRPTENLMEFDKNIIYLDKKDYKIAIGYQDNSLDNQDFSDLASSVELDLYQEKIRPSFGSSFTSDNSSDETLSNSVLQNDDIESIDQNAVVERYKEEIYGKVRVLNCSRDSPRRNVVLLKTHRTGSTSIGNLFYRYGDVKNLSFLLPSGSTFNYYWPLRFHYSHTRLDLLNRDKANMAVNIGRFSWKNIIPMMPNDTVVLTILRDPVRHFESVFEYAEVAHLLGLLNSSQDPFSTFLDAPRNNVVVFVKQSSSFAAELNLLKNGLSFDLGLDHESYSNEEDIKEFIKKVHQQLDLVLISEYIDESLVLLKRLLCWELDDVIYVRHKVRNDIYRNKIKDEHKAVIRNWSKADVMLYEHFNQSLWSKIAEQNESFFDELKTFRQRLNEVNSNCFQDKHHSRSFEKSFTLKKGLSQEMQQNCERMMLKDRDYVRIFKERQQQDIAAFNIEFINRRFYRESNSSRIYYEHDNFAFSNITNSTFDLK